MLMPIVSMNKMAMNESVAATCCYKEVGSTNNIYWQPLNGGHLGPSYVENLGWIDDKAKAWGQLSFDVNGLIDSNGVWQEGGHVLSKRVDSLGNSEWWIDEAKTVDQWIADMPHVSRGRSCSHSDGTCPYRVFKITYETNQHVGATTKHTTGGDDWDKPHTAKQFNS